MEILKDLLAALSVILNGLPQGLLALSFGFASVPTALAFIIGAVGNLAVGSVAPISFQAETITLAGTMGKNMQERLSMIFYGAGIMALIGLFGLLETIIDFIGPVITNGMMAGVGIMLTKVAIDMSRKNKIVGLPSIAIGFLVYMYTKDLVYTIAVSVVLSSLVSIILKKETEINIVGREKFILQKFVINPDVVRGAMAMVCLNIGANIAFGNITGKIAQTDVNVDHLAVISSLADMASSLFGGGPVESIISATGSAPNPVLSGVMMMGIMAIILLSGLLPKLGKYIPSESIAGFLFVLGAIVTVPVNATMALSGGGMPSDSIVGGVTMTITAITDPFLGMLAGLVVKLFAGIFGL
ncbi:MAG: adenine/guanine/hypoxanthine permease [Clostridia bacterium]|jgi:AGZA family xanthine/uracil permease-like MFS transporter|nr:adenine/guanine/hypoxanthine permease [Clostridia bacterium]MDN5323323.1 adenine/guanine/hypoxanthine permease [Clostridia bacterium]